MRPRSPVPLFYRLLEFCMLLNSGYLARVLIAEPWIKNAVPFGGDVPPLGKRVTSVVIRSERHLLRLLAARPFAFAVCGSDFKGSSRLESIFRTLSRPCFRALSSPSDLEIRLAQGGKRRGTEEVQRARTGPTDRRLASEWFGCAGRSKTNLKFEIENLK
jgi:hypothetical protein